MGSEKMSVLAEILYDREDFTMTKKGGPMRRLCPQWINRHLVETIALPFLISFLSQWLAMFVFRWIH
jgi:hypothetical protein